MSEASSSPENFELMDHEDEEQILAELRGVPVDKFIYRDPRGNPELTYAGAKWVVRKMAEEGEAIRIDGHPKVERCPIDPEYITCTVLGKRVKVNLDSKAETVLDTTIGAARGWIKQKVGKGADAKIIPDEFFFNKTVSKATRNVQLSLIPTDFKKAMIAKLIEMEKSPQGQQRRQTPQGQGRPTESTKSPAGETAKPAATEAAKNSEAAKVTQTTSTAPKSQAPGGNAVTLEALHQGFRAVFVQFTKTENKEQNQKVLKALTGKTAITDLERELMVELGPLLRLAINGKAKWTGTAIHAIPGGDQLWPKNPPQSEPAPEPQHEETPPPQPEPMF